MKVLNSKEISHVSGAFDGIHLGGNSYISNTSWFTRAWPLWKPISLAATGGYAIGTGINYVYSQSSSYFGGSGSLGSDIYTLTH